jgi:nucleotide-binding universal stress UspA family protein
MASTTHRPLAGATVFSTVLAGVDGSPEGRDAVAQAARLRAPDGTLELVTAIYLVEAGLQHWSEERIAATLELEGGQGLAEAAELAGPGATRRLLNGPPLPALLGEAERIGATLISVGTHGYSRLSEIVIGGVSGPLLHEALCSILVARPPRDPPAFPRSVVVGVDGSAPSLDALAVAEHVAQRFAVPLRAVLARRGEVDIVRAEAHVANLEVVDAHPVACLVDAAAAADLLVVGNRGLRGLRSLGSVSERVAHKAPSSVLVVRARSGLPLDP